MSGANLSSTRTPHLDVGAGEIRDSGGITLELILEASASPRGQSPNRPPIATYVPIAQHFRRRTDRSRLRWGHIQHNERAPDPRMFADQGPYLCARRDSNP